MMMTVYLFQAEFVIVSYFNNNYMTYCTSYFKVHNNIPIETVRYI